MSSYKEVAIRSSEKVDLEAGFFAACCAEVEGTALSIEPGLGQLQIFIEAHP